MYDFHTHLNHPDLFKNREQYLKDFIQQGGKGLINTGASKEYNDNALTIAQQVRLRNIPCEVKATFGFHPYEVVCAHQDPLAPQIENLLSQLQKFQPQQDIVAIGECGIDTHYPNSSKTIDAQQRLFQHHLDQAKKYGLPIVIHSRDGFEETMDVLDTQYRRQNSSALYFHCRGYGPKEVMKVLQKFPNCLIGFDGNITYDSATKTQQSLKICPLRHIVPETDAPYLTPIQHRGKKNTPAFVQEVYNYICRAKNVALETWNTHLEQIWKQFRRKR